MQTTKSRFQPKDAINYSTLDRNFRVRLKVWRARRFRNRATPGFVNISFNPPALRSCRIRSPLWTRASEINVHQQFKPSTDLYRFKRRGWEFSLFPFFSFFKFFTHESAKVRRITKLIRSISTNFTSETRARHFSSRRRRRRRRRRRGGLKEKKDFQPSGIGKSFPYSYLRIQRQPRNAKCDEYFRGLGESGSY